MKIKGALATAGTALLLVFTSGSAHAAFPGENGSIVFDSFDGEVSQVYAVKPDGSHLRRLTVPAAGVSNYDPAVGPNGDKVAYASYSTAGGPIDVHLINFDGTDGVRLTDGPNSSAMPSFSPDGEKIVFSKPGVGADAIATINVDGTGLTQLFGPAFALNPAFSPDGSKIAFFGPTGGLWLMEADGSDPHQIAAGGLAGHGRPSFSPDGTRIAFGSMQTEVGQTLMGAGIHSIKPDGTDRRLEVPVSLPNQPSFPAYSPDGKSLAYVNEFLDFSSPEPPPRTIRILDLTAGTSVPVPTEQTNIEQIDWGVFAPEPPSCETDPSLCPPPPECKTRFTKARFFVFKKQSAYRLVARYWSKEPGEVEISFFARDSDGSKGKSMGSLTRSFQTEGRFRVRKTVGKQRMKQLRESKHGFIADFRIKGALPDYCEMAGSLELTDPQRVKNQFVWFQPGS